MTVASDYFDSAYSSGTGPAWSGTGNLDTGGTATCTIVSGKPYSFPYLYIYDPLALDGVDPSSRVTNLKVTFDDEANGWTGTSSIRWEGTIGGVSATGTTLSHTMAPAFTARSYDGNMSYWGLGSFDSRNIFVALQNGTLKLRYDPTPAVLTLGDDVRVRSAICYVTYTEVDTKRAAIVTCIN